MERDTEKSNVSLMPQRTFLFLINPILCPRNQYFFLCFRGQTLTMPAKLVIFSLISRAMFNGVVRSHSACGWVIACGVMTGGHCRHPTPHYKVLPQLDNQPPIQSHRIPQCSKHRPLQIRKNRLLGRIHYAD